MGRLRIRPFTTIRSAYDPLLDNRTTYGSAYDLFVVRLLVSHTTIYFSFILLLTYRTIKHKNQKFAFWVDCLMISDLITGSTSCEISLVDWNSRFVDRLWSFAFRAGSELALGYEFCHLFPLLLRLDGGKTESNANVFLLELACITTWTKIIIIRRWTHIKTSGESVQA